MNKINLLEYFYHVAKNGSISKGALSMGITQPTVTKMIRELEELKNKQLIQIDKRYSFHSSLKLSYTNESPNNVLLFLKDIL